MNGLARIKGYYPKKEFYQPDYDKEQDPLPDYRNTLLWAPDIITDENGNATLEFFTFLWCNRRHQRQRHIR
jgi:hypothetical protein